MIEGGHTAASRGCADLVAATCRLVVSYAKRSEKSLSVVYGGRQSATIPVSDRCNYWQIKHRYESATGSTPYKALLTDES
jgi:hypothetical protein